MKGDAKVIQYLNKALGNELVGINQYYLHAKMLQNWGFSTLGKTIKDNSIEEMKHADKIIERILFLEGLPNLQDYDKIHIGENVEEMFACDLKLETNAVALLKEAMDYCDSVKDFVTTDLLQEILNSEEEHVHWLETQLNLIKHTGLQNYLQNQSD